MKKTLFIVLVMISLNGFAADTMTQEHMERIVKEMADSATGGQGIVEFQYQGMPMYLISDVDHDRMRIISPIVPYSALSIEQIDKTMQANFHSAIDARYAVSDGVLYAAYIHPLSKLDRGQLQSAVKQVFNLNSTFGGDYNSGALSFGDNPADDESSEAPAY